jgi:serine/threonine protein kinase
VKPSNLLIRPDGQLVLMDFGLSKLLDNVSLETQTAILGTVAYMAPEQCQGFVSAASDRYMLGVVLYEMLAGKLPYEGNTTKVLLSHVHSAPDSLVSQPTMQAAPPEVVLALDEVVARVLAKQPNDRYPSCQALSYAYHQALARVPRRTPGLQGSNKITAQHILDGTLISNENPLALFPPAMQAASPDATILAPGPKQQKKVMLRPARLLVTTEPQKVFSAAFDLVGDTLTLGRAQDNHVCIPLAIISRHHAELSLLNSETKEVTYKIVERKTINPLYFNGKKIAEKVLEDGDTLVIGERGYTEYIVKLTYQAPEYGFM